jgi:hypothetical protein
MPINLYLDWQDKSTFVGIGEILEKQEEKPIVSLGKKYYLPSRCLVKVITSDFYPEGFEKHFIIPLQISSTEANRILKKTDKPGDKISYRLAEDILMRGNPLVDSMLDLELRELYIQVRADYIFNNKPVPNEIMVDIIKRKKEADEYRNLRR